MRTLAALVLFLSLAVISTVGARDHVRNCDFAIELYTKNKKLCDGGILDNGMSITTCERARILYENYETCTKGSSPVKADKKNPPDVKRQTPVRTEKKRPDPVKAKKVKEYGVAVTLVTVEGAEERLFVASSKKSHKHAEKLAVAKCHRAVRATCRRNAIRKSGIPPRKLKNIRNYGWGDPSVRKFKQLKDSCEKFFLNERGCKKLEEYSSGQCFAVGGYWVETPKMSRQANAVLFSSIGSTRKDAESGVKTRCTQYIGPDRPLLYHLGACPIITSGCSPSAVEANMK